MISFIVCQSSIERLPGRLCSIVSLTSGPINRAQVSKMTAGLVLAVLTIVSRPSSDQTSARSRSKPAEKAWRIPTGRPFKLPDWPGFHWVGLLTSVMFDTCFHLIFSQLRGDPLFDNQKLPPVQLLLDAL